MNGCVYKAVYEQSPPLSTCRSQERHAPQQTVSACAFPTNCSRPSTHVVCSSVRSQKHDALVCPEHNANRQPPSQSTTLSWISGCRPLNTRLRCKLVARTLSSCVTLSAPTRPSKPAHGATGTKGSCTASCQKPRHTYPNQFKTTAGPLQQIPRVRQPPTPPSS